jgi:hypothetical protein
MELRFYEEIACKEVYKFKQTYYNFCGRNAINKDKSGRKSRGSIKITRSWKYCLER